MFENYVADTAETILPVLCKDLLSAPVRSSRNGEMRELTNVRIRLVNPLDREILLSSRRASYPPERQYLHLRLLLQPPQRGRG